MVGKLKVLVVDDSVIYRRIVIDAVEATGIAEVKHSASNGVLALERLQHGKYDIVLLDINMPELDGMETLKQIKQNWPNLSVVMVSGDGGGSVNVCEALKNGAMDFVIKPLKENCSKNTELLRNNLLVIFQQINIRRFSMADVTDNTEYDTAITNSENILERNYKNKNQKDKVNSQYVAKRLTGVDLVLVTASTGGPSALEKLFVNFKNSINVPLLVVQHMPPDFTNVLAQSLDKKTNILFKEGKEGDIIVPGEGIIAPGGLHMLVSSEGTNKKVILSKSEYVNGVRPAADVLFKSVAQEYQGARVLAVVLTGMGCDGMEGIRKLKEKCSCYCITQTEASCVVYGMPRSVFEAGLSDEVLDIDNIAARIQHIVEHGS